MRPIRWSAGMLLVATAMASLAVVRTAVADCGSPFDLVSGTVVNQNRSTEQVLMQVRSCDQAVRPSGSDIRPGSNAIRVVTTEGQPENGVVTFAGKEHQLTFSAGPGVWQSEWIAITQQASVFGGRADVTLCRRDAGGLQHCYSRPFETMTSCPAETDPGELPIRQPFDLDRRLCS